ncbi:MAG: hypothetical protein MJ238_05510, partial [Bacilli bacterium]|nr:hypothetical protein [Bacilli bacterium]
KTLTDIKNVPHFQEALNRLLPKDIVVKSIEKKDEGFHARHSSAGKVYVYKFHYGKPGDRDPFAQDEYQLEWTRFDFDLFEAAMKSYEGVHNFQNFTVKKEGVDGFIRNIKEIDVQRFEGNHVVVTLSGNGFMTYMVRMMIGMAFKVAFGKLPLETIDEMLNSEERKFSCFKAPPEGLTLKKVIYE